VALNGRAPAAPRSRCTSAAGTPTGNSRRSRGDGTPPATRAPPWGMGRQPASAPCTVATSRQAASARPAPSRRHANRNARRAPWRREANAQSRYAWQPDAAGRLAAVRRRATRRRTLRRPPRARPSHVDVSNAQSGARARGRRSPGAPPVEPCGHGASATIAESTAPGTAASARDEDGRQAPAASSPCAAPQRFGARCPHSHRSAVAPGRNWGVRRLPALTRRRRLTVRKEVSETVVTRHSAGTPAPP
jgi:hypothetical protein